MHKCRREVRMHHPLTGRAKTNPVPSSPAPRDSGGGPRSGGLSDSVTIYPLSNRTEADLLSEKTYLEREDIYLISIK